MTDLLELETDLALRRGIGLAGDSLAQRGAAGKVLGAGGVLDRVGKQVSDASKNRAKSVYYSVLDGTDGTRP